MKPYYNILHDLRQDSNLTQESIARILRTSRQQYARYESGTYPFPFEMILILAKTYGVSLDYIAGRTECEKGVDALNAEFLPGYSAGKLLSDFDALSPSDRKTILDHIRFLKAQKTK